MSIQKPVLLICLVLLGTFSRSFSQIVATPSTGCSPLSVVFSGPAGATNVFWTLGNGIGTSSLSSPNPIYNTPGQYNITYTAIVNGNPVSYTKLLVVNAPPIASFNYVIPSSHCAPMTASFTASGGGAGAIYSWGFGDLTALVTGNSVTHAYTYANNFIPVMTVMDAVTGCTAIASGSGTISVSTPPVANVISSNGFVGCVPPFTTNITGTTSVNGSPLGGSLSYNWVFGNGTPNSSGLPTPGNVSFGAGNNVLSLTVSDNNQCSTTFTTFVSVVNPTLTATVPGTVCLYAPVPATVLTLQNSVTFNMSSISTPTVINVTPGVQTKIDTVCKFFSPGPQTMTLSVQASGLCPSYTLVKNIFVEEVIPSFTNTPPHSTCFSTLAATYLNLSTTNTGAALIYTWTAAIPPNSTHSVFPGTILMNNPGPANFTFTQGSLNPYTIYNYLSPNITLIAMSPFGCSASTVISTYDTVVRPTAFFATNKKKGCAPLTIQFRDTSFFAPTFSVPVSNYTWCNGAPGSSSQVAIGTLSPSFTYTNPGTYYPYLVIQSPQGCRDTSFIDTIHVGTPPIITATFPSSACAGQSVTINMSASASSTTEPIDHYHVSTDGGYFSGCVTNASPSFPFTHVGVHTVVVTAYQAGCAGSNTFIPTITINGPIGKFRYETTCTGNRRVVNFYIHLQEASSAILNFGDNSQVPITGNSAGTTTAMVTHTYVNTGNFVATMNSVRVPGNCPPYIFTQTVTVRDPKAQITWNGQPIPALPQALCCTKTKYQFTAHTSTDQDVTCSQGYTWFFTAPGYTNPPAACQDPVMMTHTHGSPLKRIMDPTSRDTFRVAGIYTLTLRIKDVNHCIDEDTKIFRVGAAKPVFTFSNNPACYSDGPVQIINHTQDSLITPDLVSNYVWHYGDGSTTTATNPYDSPSHQYPMVNPPSQTFTVLCIATNTLGCIDSTYNTIQINNPYPNFSSTNLFPCLPLNQGVPVGFLANQGYATYSVSYGDPPNAPTWQSSATYTNASHFYNKPGIYTPTLTVVDAAGCKASNTVTITAIGQPTASVNFLSGNKFCLPGEPKLKSTSKINVTPIDNYVWSIGTLVSPPSPADSLYNIFTTPGVFTINLTVSMGANQLCPSTTSAQVYVYDTKATATLDKTTFCLGETIKATVSGLKDVYSWQWFFGDLVQQNITFNTPFAANPVLYPYNIYPTGGVNGSAVVVLKFTSDGDSGCVKTNTIGIQVIKIDADYLAEYNAFRHCLNPVDNFSNTTLNPLNLNLSYDWSFGDNSFDKGQVVTHRYMTAGNYTVSLTVTDAVYSCSNTVVHTMSVLPLPVAKISIVDTLICPDTPFSVALSGTPGVSGTLTGVVFPIDTKTLDLSPSNTLVLTTSITASTEFDFTVTDENGCEAYPVKDYVEVPPLAPGVNQVTNTIIGDPIHLEAPTGINFSYLWTPEARFLSDTMIYNPVSTTTADITYTVLITDEPLHCFVTPSTYSIHILPLTTVDVPTAFSPNGDGVNDVVVPAGWGIRKLNYFRIFNRWGQLIFESTDIRQGWDGTFQGLPQNSETYVYQVEVETYLSDNPRISKTGTIKLLR